MARSDPPILACELPQARSRCCALSCIAVQACSHAARHGVPCRSALPYIGPAPTPPGGATKRVQPRDDREEGSMLTTQSGSAPALRPSQASAWLAELRATAALSGPLVLTNLAQVAMGATDVMMMGWIGAETLAAGALGVNVYFVALILGIGLTSATSPMVARELGRNLNAVRDVRRTVRQGLWAAACIALPCWLVLWWTEPLLIAIGQAPALSAPAGVY